MAAEFVLNAELRTDKGKGASRRLRRNADLVPAILYGAGKDPQSLSIAHRELHRALQNEAFFSHIITLQAEGKSQQVILKDLQRHPAKDRIMHADFYRVEMDKAITVEVPLHFINEENCVGFKQSGGIISHTMSSLVISCLPGLLPEFIEVDVLDLDIGDSIHMSGIVLPEGLSIPELAHGEDHDQVVVAVHAPKRVEEIEETDEAVDSDDAAADDSSDESTDSE
ncbi:MAG: 50S ribosomal protein L25/general stress protein Ctc [Pseudomonadales bacterium]|jgi:large subunit ribosomal protein L25